MGLSDINVHNVLRTYARQERLGKVHRAKPKHSGATRSADRVSLSSTGQKVQWIGQLAAEMVDREPPQQLSHDRSAQIRRLKQGLLEHHREEIDDEALPLEALEARLRPLYLG